MHVEIRREGASVHLAYSPGPGEPRVLPRARMVRRTARYEAHDGPIHPDLLVLSALLTARPFFDPAVPVTTSVSASSALAAAVRAAWRLRLGTVDPSLAPRTAPRDAVPALCFSGGTDSVATLALMPAGTRSYFLRRRRPPGDARRTQLRPAAADESCLTVDRLGYPVTVVDTDMEHLREPIGFADDLANAVPALLHADVDALDAVAWGAPLEATYRLQVGRYRDYRESSFIRTTGRVLRAVGVEPLVPVAGLSEVVTSRIVAEHPLGVAAQSCMRGRRLGQPCLRCAKCARKTLLRGAVTGRWPAAGELERILTHPEPRNHLLAEPIKVEPVVAHCVHRYLAEVPRGEQSELLRLVAAKVGPDPLPWLRRSYEPALELLPERYREECRAVVRTWAEPMTPEEEEAVRTYRDASVEDPARRAAAQAELTAWYREHEPGAVRGTLRRAVRGGPRRVVNAAASAWLRRSTRGW